MRPYIGKVGKIKKLKPGEQQVGERNDLLKNYAEDARLVMRRSPLTPYTTYALALLNSPRNKVCLINSIEPCMKPIGQTSKTSVISTLYGESLGSLASVGYLLEDRLKTGFYEQLITDQF